MWLYQINLVTNIKALAFALKSTENDKSNNGGVSTE